MNTPLWLTLLVAALSPAAALLGVWLTQRRADRRDDATFARELKRERERWQREDEARTFENRRVAYVEFFEALRRMHITVEQFAMGHIGTAFSELDEDWTVDAWEKLQHLQIYATPHVGSLASKAFFLTQDCGSATSYGDFRTANYHARADIMDRAKDTLLQAIRSDLRVPDTAELARTEPTGADQSMAGQPLPWF